MPRTLQTPPTTKSSDGLRTGQLRVLQFLAPYDGLATRGTIADGLGCSDVYVGKMLGMSNPESRAAFERTKDGGGSPDNPCPSLLTLGFVREVELDVDGVTERSYEITPAGRAGLSLVKPGDLPPVRD